MTPATRHSYARTLVAVPFALFLSVAGIAACGDDTTGTGEAEDVDKVGEKITVWAEVKEVVSDHSFTVIGTKITSLDALLVVSVDDFNPKEDTQVQITGILREDFDAVRVGKELGLRWKADPAKPFNGEHYIQAIKVEN